METHQTHLKLRSGKFSIEKHQHENVGMTERFVSVFAGAILLRNSLKNPFKSKFLYGAYLTYRGFTGHCLVYERLDIDASKPHAANIRGEFVIDRPVDEVYAYWKNINNLPGSINHLFDVKVQSEKLSNWKSKVLGHILPVNWTAEIVKEEAGHMIGWRSTAGSVLQHVGKVEFDATADGGGTILKVVLSYHPPIGGLGIGLARLFNPVFEHLLSKEIKTFKHEIESPAPY